MIILKTREIPLFEHNIKCYFEKPHIEKPSICQYTINTNLINKLYEFGFVHEFDSRLSCNFGYRFNCGLDNVLKTNINKTKPPTRFRFLPTSTHMSLQEFHINLQSEFLLLKISGIFCFSILDFLIFLSSYLLIFLFSFFLFLIY